jgi:hypothetical protein
LLRDDRNVGRKWRRDEKSSGGENDGATLRERKETAEETTRGITPTAKHTLFTDEHALGVGTHRGVGLLPAQVPLWAKREVGIVGSAAWSPGMDRRKERGVGRQMAPGGGSMAVSRSTKG